MKKAELKEGVAYYVATSKKWIHTYHTSAFKTHDYHKCNRYYVIIRGDNKPMSYYRSDNKVYVTNCKTYGSNCPTHKREDSVGIHCYRKSVRLMDIHGEYWQVIKDMIAKRKAQPTRDVRAERLARIAKRQRQEQEKPIKEEFYRVLSHITESYCSQWDKLGGFTPKQMQAITKALKAGMETPLQVAS